MSYSSDLSYAHLLHLNVFSISSFDQSKPSEKEIYTRLTKLIAVDKEDSTVAEDKNIDENSKTFYFSVWKVFNRYSPRYVQLHLTTLVKTYLNWKRTSQRTWNWGLYRTTSMYSRGSYGIRIFSRCKMFIGAETCRLTRKHCLDNLNDWRTHSLSRKEGTDGFRTQKK